MITGGRPGRTRAILVALAVSPLLSGCIAAAALPVLAAGGVVKSRTDDRRSDQRPARVAIPADPAPASPAGPTPVAKDYTLSDGTHVSVTNTLRAPVVDAQEKPAPPPSAGSGYRVTTLTDLPPPSAGTPPETIADSVSSYSAFVDYVLEKGAVPVIGLERHSAMLAEPNQMTAETKVCSVQPAGVLIDLDPRGGDLDIEASSIADASIRDELARIRKNGVVIGWVSNRTADQAGTIRRALERTGLDPSGDDELVLLRLPDDRKQSRRDDFANTHCVVAIAGDEKSDFDELFDYVRDPSKALALDTLIGAGWFLVPSPLATN